MILLAAPPVLPPEGVRVQLVQRDVAVLPGGEWRLRLGDITRGQVYAAIEPVTGGAPSFESSVVAGGRYTFALDGAPVVLEVEQLVNYMIGNDFAVLRLRSGGGASAPVSAAPSAAVPAVTIDRLLEDLQRSGAVFIREGEAFDATRAASHLRDKWKRAPEITTPEDFIERIASRSSTTGRPYRVRLPDGTESEAGPWLRARLEALRKGR